MSNEADRFWDQVQSELRHYMKLAPQSDEDIQKQLDDIKSEPLSEEEIESLVKSVTSGNIPNASRRVDLSWIKDHDTENITKEICFLNRNEGEQDQEIDDRLNELRKKALDEKSPNDAQEPREKFNRMEDDEAAGEEGS